MVIPYSVLCNDDLRITEYFGDNAIKSYCENYILEAKGNKEKIDGLKEAIIKRTDGTYKKTYLQIRKELKIDE